MEMDIRQLEDADAATLRQLWAAAKGSKAPKTFTARLMRLVLAWDAQAAREGGEPAKSKRDWNRIIRAQSNQKSNPDSTPTGAFAARDGTRLLKEWGGTTHEVLVTGDGGATWNGQSYTSLSAVARAMTGTNRNGPKFFGLREGGKS